MINRNFNTDKPNEKWTIDVSQFAFGWGKCYLSPIMDMFNDEIVGYDLSLRADYQQIERMLSSANISNKNLSNLVFHSDQGWQYQNPRYVKYLKNNNIKQSMSRKGNCIDNCIMESFFGRMKDEIYYGHENEYETFNDFKIVVGDYINYYNNERIKEKIGWLSLVEFRIKCRFNT